MKTVSELLIEAARRNPPSDRVPEGFDRSFMDRLEQRSNSLAGGRTQPTAPFDDWGIWTRTFLRAAWSGALVAGFLAIGSMMMPLPVTDEFNEVGVSDLGGSALDEGGGEIW